VSVDAADLSQNDSLQFFDCYLRSSDYVEMDRTRSDYTYLLVIHSIIISVRPDGDFLLVLPSFSFLHKKEVGRVLLRGQF